MRVQDIMTSPVIGIRPSASVGEAAKLMLENHISGLPVTEDDGTLLGIISEGDLLRRHELETERAKPSWLVEFFANPARVAEEYVHTHGRTVEEVMSGAPATTEKAATLEEVVDLMEENRVKRLPVMDGVRLVGIVSRSDLLRALSRRLSEQTAEVPGSDDAIRRAIETELAGQSWSGVGMIRVTVRDGIATLAGTIYNDEARRAAKVVAENVSGVKSVHDDLNWVEPVSGMVILP